MQESVVFPWPRVGAGLLLGRRFENELGEIVERLLPVLEVVRMFIHVPDVSNFLFIQVGVDTLTDANQTILVSAGKVEKS